MFKIFSKPFSELWLRPISNPLWQHRAKSTTIHPLTQISSQAKSIFGKFASLKPQETTTSHCSEVHSLNFKEFKETRVKSIEEFINSPQTKALFQNPHNRNPEVNRAYDDYCLLKYNQYLKLQSKSDLAKMT